jgi:hypothetical protein
VSGSRWKTGRCPSSRRSRRAAEPLGASECLRPLDGKADGAVPASHGMSSASKFLSTRSHRVMEGVGHNLPEEAPKEFAAAVLQLASARRGG